MAIPSFCCVELVQARPNEDMLINVVYMHSDGAGTLLRY